MFPLSTRSKTRILTTLLTVLLAVGSAFAAEEAKPGKPAKWWDDKWPTRKKITIDTSAKGLAIADEIGTSAVLVRLHDGDFSFLAAKEDGSDLRFVDDDQKTVLKHHIEKWDGLLNEAYVWVQVPEVKPSATSTIWLYYGNTADAARTDDAKGTYDAATVNVYHFGDAATVGADSAVGGVALQNTSPPVSGAVIGSGQRLLGQTPVTLPENAATEWAAGSSLTWSAWIKPATLQANVVIFSRRDGGNSFVVGLDNGVPFVEINKQRSSAGAATTPLVWHHLAVVVKESAATVYLDGASFGTLSAALPELKGPALIGKDSTPGLTAFVGEIDEIQIAKAARPAGWVKFAAVSQGTSSDAAKLLVIGNDEASGKGEEGELAKHLSLLTDISKNLTPDGWAVIGACTLLAIVGGFVAIGKVLYLNKISKATGSFLEQWDKVSSDLTVLDVQEGDDGESIKTMGGAAAGKKVQRLMHQSPLYHIYHLGCMEVQERVQQFRKLSITPGSPRVEKGLSGRSIQAIKATLHGGLMREVQKLNSKLVFLTIGIAGGPYLGLLGTVIGVMITFAVIAKSGQVEVNSIAPGIAGALLATVAGLAVAIPCLFAYSYISTRIKDAVTDMETFIDEFVAKMAEHYKE